MKVPAVNRRHTTILAEVFAGTRLPLGLEDGRSARNVHDAVSNRWVRLS